jgi:hypothetical protein
VIGIRLPGDPPWEYGGASGVPPRSASLYCPGAANRSSAATITPLTDENRDNIDFTIAAK